ncbi:unnamed protein product, partial [marine sediment metagenome]
MIEVSSQEPPGRMLELGEYLEIQDLARQGVGWGWAPELLA